MATVIWNKEVRGLYTKEEAERELERLVALGLDRSVLFSVYQAEEHQGAPCPWLDINFQMNALRKFLPENAASSEDEAPEPVRVKPIISASIRL